MASRLSYFALFKDWRMAVYLALSVPAVVLQASFAAALATSPNLSALGFVTRYLAYVPWALVLLSVYAVLRFRTAMLLTLLTAAYFLSAVVAGTAAIYGPQGVGAGVISGLVVLAAFLALISFGYARGATVLKGKKAIITTGRALHFQVLGFGFDFVLPVAIAIGLVILTEQLFKGVEGVVASLPPPLNSVLSSQFVGSITAAFLTILFTTVTLWVVRELVEPWVQYFAFTREDAVNQLMYDYNQMVSKSERAPYRRPRVVLFGVLAALLLAGGAVLAFGTQSVASNLGALFGAGHPTTEHGFYSQAQGVYGQVQGAISTILRLLWG